MSTELNLNSALTQYAINTKLPFLARLVNEGHTLEFATIQPNVKYKDFINVVSADGNFQYGGVCAGADSQATTSSFESRELLACKKTMFDSVCMNNVETYYNGLFPAGNLDSVEAVDTIVNPLMETALSHFQKQVEVDLWNKAGTSQCGGTDGLYTYISGSTSGVRYSGSADFTWQGGVAVDTPTKANILSQVNSLYLNASDDATQKADLACIMSTANFRTYLVALAESTATALGGYEVKQTANGALSYVKHPTIPNLTIFGTIGLAGSGRIVIGSYSDIVVGTDLASDATDYQLWYDINDDAIKYRISAKFGANIANPTQWISNDIA